MLESSSAENIAGILARALTHQQALGAASPAWRHMKAEASDKVVMRRHQTKYPVGNRHQTSSKAGNGQLNMLQYQRLY